MSVNEIVHTSLTSMGKMPFTYLESTYTVDLDHSARGRLPQQNILQIRGVLSDGD